MYAVAVVAVVAVVVLVACLFWSMHSHMQVARKAPDRSRAIKNGIYIYIYIHIDICNTWINRHVSYTLSSIIQNKRVFVPLKWDWDRGGHARRC